MAFSSFMNQKYRQSPWIAGLFCELRPVSMTTAVITGRSQTPWYLVNIQEILPEGLSTWFKITHPYHGPGRGQGLQAACRRKMQGASASVSTPPYVFPCLRCHLIIGNRKRNALLLRKSHS